MEIIVSIPDYNESDGIKYNWESGFEIEIKNNNGTIYIIANKAGLKSLANHFLNLAQEKIPTGYHLHFDENNSLEEGSLDLIIEKKEN